MPLPTDLLTLSAKCGKTELRTENSSAECRFCLWNHGTVAAVNRYIQIAAAHWMSVPALQNR